MPTDIAQKIDRVAELLATDRHGVALTGAGVSVDSGIPDFRSPGGLWDRFDPMEYATINAFRADPDRVWQMLGVFGDILKAAKPNPGHRGLSRLEQAGVLDGIVTQNVDNLHQAAGSRRVIEFHGNGSRLRCLECDGMEPSNEDLQLPPRCTKCESVLKPDVVFFGEPIPEEALQGSMELLDECKVMLVVGTSATVAPASMLPIAAKQNGAHLVEINLEATELTHLCDLAVHAGTSEAMPLLADRVERLLAG